MSDTPRTDVLLIAHDMSPEPNIIIKHAQELERELNAANERIKRLEEALTSIGEYWNRDANERAMEDACWYAVNTAANALEAKEAKP